MKRVLTNNGLKTVVAASLMVLSQAAMSHGDVSPQPVDTEGLDQLCDDWLERNPYVGNEKAISIGSSAYNQNCARCHGLGAVSGGIAPDLRELTNDAEGDEWFQGRVRNGAVRNGITYMPKFAESEGGPLSQEALWSIRAYIQTIAIDGAEVVEDRTEAQIKAEKACIVPAKAVKATAVDTKMVEAHAEAAVTEKVAVKPAVEAAAVKAVTNPTEKAVKEKVTEAKPSQTAVKKESDCDKNK